MSCEHNETASQAHPQLNPHHLISHHVFTISPSSRTSVILPTVSSLRKTLTRIFGNLATHAARDHRAATSMQPRLMTANSTCLLDPDTADLIQQSPELEQSAESPASNQRKLLVIRSHPLLNQVWPSGWQTAEILNQSLPRRLHGREVVVLQCWCRGKAPSMLLPSLIAQSISASVFDTCALMRMRNPPPSSAGGGGGGGGGGWPQACDLLKLVQRDPQYLLKTLDWLFRMLERETTVFIVFDAFGEMEERLRGQAWERSQILIALLTLLRRPRGAGAIVDVRVLIMSPRFQDGSPEFVDNEILRDVWRENGSLLDCNAQAEEERSQLHSPGFDIDGVSAESTDSWHTAAESASPPSGYATPRIW